ncbi:MAG TPA: hypothetical protein VLB68_15020 [Pyrinomonadaceae bacterium]|nr:hypothetical protein [Pyrinomonadaceae bacterium]
MFHFEWGASSGLVYRVSAIARRKIFVTGDMGKGLLPAVWKLL